MGELTIEQLIKIIIGIAVVVAVVIGVYLFFRNSVLDLFKVIPNQTGKFILGLVR